MADEARTRAPRAETVAAERRRRQPGTLDRMDHLKLAIPDEIREQNPGHVFHWARDDAARMHTLTVKDDWDRVDGVQAIPDGADKNGRQINLVLLKKREDYWQEDQRSKQAALKEQEQALLSASKSDPQDDRSEATSYVPDGNSIKSGYAP